MWYKVLPLYVIHSDLLICTLVLYGGSLYGSTVLLLIHQYMFERVKIIKLD